jgi:hypothetical protein
MAYKVRLPSQLAAIHEVFHISTTEMCHNSCRLEQQEIMVEPDLSYVEQPIKILD